MLEKPAGYTADAYLRHLNDSAHCSSLSKLMNRYRNELGETHLDHILNYKHDATSIAMCAQYVLRHGADDHKFIVSCLNTKDWLYYHTFHKYVRLRNRILFDDTSVVDGAIHRR
jgi:hypothetical protein